MSPIDRSAGLPGCSIIYAPRGQAGEYAPLATNPYRGCGHKCAYCLHPDTLVQMADGSARRIGDIAIGDNLIGVATRPKTRRAWNHTFAASLVVNKITTRKSAVRITLENGRSVVCSHDHRWLTERGWKYARDLTASNSIRFLSTGAIATPEASPDYRRGYLAGMIRGDGTLKRYDYSGRFQRANRKTPQATDVQHHFRLALVDTIALDRVASYLSDFDIATHRVQFSAAAGARAPVEAIRANSRDAFDGITDLVAIREESFEWRRGWIAGVFDAEGGTTSGTIRIHNTDEEILSATERALAALGFRTVREARRPNGCQAVRVLGGMSEIVRFFNLTAPAIGRKFPVVGKALRGSIRIFSVEHTGEVIDMVDITTSTENFIAEGLVSHNCYVPRVLRMDRREFDAGAVPRKDFLRLLRKDAAKYQSAGIGAQVMLSFTTDPYPLEHHLLTREVLEALIEHGLGFCTLTKGGARALRDLDLFRPERDAFASTLTSLDPAFSAKWERGAALPDDRIATLRRFHEAGIFTWVSLEPTLSAEASLAIVEATHSFVDLYKVGRANYLPMTTSTDWQDYTLRMVELLGRLGARHYIKRDLQRYLPADYPNLLRVEQHH